MNRRTYALAAALAGVSAAAAYLFWLAPQGPAPGVTGRIGFELVPDTGLQQGADRRRASAWKAGERSFYEQFLANGSFDVLIVPLEPYGDGLSRAMRSLMTAELSHAVAAGSGLKVPDPYLVARALGDGDRRHSMEDVYRLAARLQVKRIVWCMVGQHPKAGPGWGLSVSVQFQDRHRGVLDATGEVRSAAFHKKVAGASPLDTFAAMIPDILTALDLEAEEPIAANAAPATVPALPANPSGLLAPSESIAQHAYVFQALALLAPANAERTRERLMEKSLLAANRLPADSSASRVLRARSLLYLGYRPVARTILGEPATAEETQLRAKLDGNLPDAQRATDAVTDPLPKLIARLETNEFAVAYGARDRGAIEQEVQSWALPGEIWPFLAARAALDGEGWAQFENLPFKYVLDREFPLADFTAEGIVGGSASIADAEGLRTRADLSVLEHVRRLMRAKASEWCCEAAGRRPHPMDYLDLLESIGTANLVRNALFQLYTQGSPERALELLTQYDTAYKDHPQFVMARVAAEREMAKRSDGAAKQGYLASAYESAYNVLFWEQGPTRSAASAMFHLQGPEPAQYVPVYDPYAGEQPVRPYYPSSHATVDEGIRAQFAALENSATDFTPVDRLMYYATRFPDALGVDQVLKALEGRFIGHASRAALVADHQAGAGETELAEKNYREALAVEAGNWHVRHRLASLLFENGRLEEAARLYADYPGFRPESHEHPVGLANQAYDAGSDFYWSGNFDLARPLYAIASALQTGSESSLASEMRLNLLDGNFQTAFEISLARARRYNSSYAYRDYLSLLHAMGRSAEAWQAFDVLAAEQADRPHLWESALVGHRLAGLSEADVAAWARRDLLRNVGATLNYSAMHLVRAAVTDRKPSAEFPQRLEAVDRPMWQLSPDGQVVRPVGDGRSVNVLGPNNGVGEGMLPFAIDDVAPAEKTRVPTDLAHFVKAYGLIRSGNPAAANAEFELATKTLELRQDQLQYLLAYFAFAAAQAKQTSTIEAILGSIPPTHQRFDYLLAKGAIAAISGDHAKAQQLLKTALLRRPHTEARPVLVEYQYAELCEWLFRATKNAAYRDLAVSWAKKSQVFYPWHAWAYAVEATLSTVPAERRRAIAMTRYLDRNSERLASIPRSEVDAAVRQYSGRLPFPALPGRSDAT